MNHKKIGKHPERISNIKPFTDKYSWKDINVPAGIKDWKNFEQNNKTISLNILYEDPNTKTINLTNKQKYNRKRKDQVVLLMISDDEQSAEIDKWHYTALKSERTNNGFNRPARSLSRLFRGVTSNNNGVFIVWLVYIRFELITHIKNTKDYVIID